MLNHQRVRRLRAQVQALAGGVRKEPAGAVVCHVFAMQAQDALAADLGNECADGISPLVTSVPRTTMNEALSATGVCGGTLHAPASGRAADSSGPIVIADGLVIAPRDGFSTPGRRDHPMRSSLDAAGRVRGRPSATDRSERDTGGGASGVS